MSAQMFQILVSLFWDSTARFNYLTDQFHWLLTRAQTVLFGSQLNRERLKSECVFVNVCFCIGTGRGKIVMRISTHNGKFSHFHNTHYFPSSSSFLVYTFYSNFGPLD